ncbi:hypothetical protein LguiA_020878 [Lonicera macranthoides]
MATLPPIFTTFISLLHLACFIFTSNTNNHNHNQNQNRNRNHSKKRKKLSVSWSFLKRIFSSKSTHPDTRPESSILSPSSSTRSFRQSSDIVSLIPPPSTRHSHLHRRRKTGSGSYSVSETDLSPGQPFYPLRNDIHPCPLCGEIFPKSNLLEHHQSIKHAVSELTDLDSGKNIVGIIFNTGWPKKAPNIIRILKVHNSSKILTRFEEYRERVKSRAAPNCALRLPDERCIADGNELMRFHCATFLCDLGQNGNSTLCSSPYCSVCGIIRSGFSPKMDGISTLSTSWRAHVAIPDGLEEEFGFMQLKRAMLVCRVIAGRVGCDPNVVDKDDSGYDSLAGRAGGVHAARLDGEDELLVFNPRAVLPCFVIVYSV